MEHPPLPIGTVEAFALNGDYDFRSPTNREGTLRSARIVSSVKLAAEAARSATTLLQDPKLYGGDGARCFIPRHGFRLSDGTRSVDILICLECSWIYFFSAASPTSVALSEDGVLMLESFFIDALGKA